MLEDLSPVVATPSPQSTEADAEWWKVKYSKLEEQFIILKRRNEDLEERMLNLVEKIECDKIVLSDEIDHLSSQLTAASNKVVSLERECARYKKDCVLAVHLLHCQPSHYIKSKNAPEGLFKEEQKPQQSASIVRGMATFPPMAVYLPETEELEVQPEDPSPIVKTLSSETDGEIAAMRNSTSFTSEFLQKIDADENYCCVELRKCAKCADIITAMSRTTQTPLPQPPRAKIVDEPPMMFTLEGRSNEQLI
uniref:Uncharacterized protein n=2 Tax=Parascaris univalens TaxID=6257 RepID=A0A915AI61_PARUN